MMPVTLLNSSPLKLSIRGFKTGIQFSSGQSISRKKRDSLAIKYVETLNEMYKIQIDTTLYDTDFLISKNKQNQVGFETYIPTKTLSEGKHILRLKRKKKVYVTYYHMKEIKILFTS